MAAGAVHPATQPASSAGSFSPPDTRFTPPSNGSEDDVPQSSKSHQRHPSRASASGLKLQTDLPNEFHGDDQADAESLLSGKDHDHDHDLEAYDSNDGRDFKKQSRGRRGGLTRPSYSAEEEQQVVRKFDWNLVPFLALLYLLSFLDRSNIGNARIAGLEDDLHLSSAQYEWLLTAFYITYILFEWMTLMYRVVPAHIYIALCVCGWGLVASFQSLATSFWTLVILRAVLGITEAAFGPGIPFYLSLFYKREELAFRNGLFISAAPLATSFASSLAWLIVSVSSDGPIAPWRTLFLVEGFPSVVVAVFAWFMIPDSPGTARFLTARQRKVARARLGEHKRSPDESQPKGFDWREVGRTLADPKSYLTACMFFSCNVAFSSMPVFLPTIIKDMGYSSLASQALSAPPYLVAFIVVLVTAYASDRQRSRSAFLILHALLSSLAYLAIAATGYFHSHLTTGLHTFIRYICVYPATAGFFSAITLIITWSMDNRVAKEGKGTSVAILNVIGQCGPLLGTRLYPRSQGPWYVNGMATCSVFMLVVAVLAFVLRVVLQRLNRAQQSGKGSGSGGGGDIEMDEFNRGGEERQGLMGGQEGHPVSGQVVEQKTFTYIV